MKTRIAVLGAGLMGERHARVLTALPDVELVGIADVDRVRGRMVAERYRTDFYESFEDLLGRVDAVAVATPTPLHYAQAKLALEQGLHVFVEKAITEYVEQGEELSALADEKKLLLQVGHIERFNPVYSELKKLVQTFHPFALCFRRLSSFSASNLAVDVVLDLMIHDIDLAFDLCPGLMATDLRAVGRVVRSREIDHAQAHLTFLDGPLCSFTASRVTEHKVRCIEVTAHDAFIVADLLQKEIRIHKNTSSAYQVSGDAVQYQQRSVVEQLQVPAQEPLHLQMADFAQSIREGRPPTVSAKEGVRALRAVREIISQIQNPSFGREPAHGHPTSRSHSALPALSNTAISSTQIAKMNDIPVW
jgi:virulence factor